MLVTIFHRAAVSLTTIVLAVTVFAPVVVSADPRCSGSPGVQVWEHESLNGRSWVICGFPKENLHNFNTNLNFWENWGDRITSFQTFNMTSTRDNCFWHGAGYEGTKYRTVGNVTILNVGSTHNDKFSSLKNQESC